MWAPWRVGSQGDEVLSKSMDQKKDTTTPVVAGRSQDQPTTTEKTNVGESVDSPQQTVVAGGSNDPPATTTEAGPQWQLPKRKRLSGAELRRRKRDREALAAAKTAEAPKTPSVKEVCPPGKARNPALKGKGMLPTGGTQKKRNRSAASEPSPGQPRKVAKKADGRFPQQNAPKPPPTKGRSDGISYKEAASRHLRVAIIDQHNPLGKTTKEQAGLVEKAMLEELDKLLSSSDTIHTFQEWTHSGEILRISCDNEPALKWLKDTVPRLPPLWEGARLTVVQVDQLPTLTKARLWIPGQPEDIDLVRKRLAAQNSAMDVKSWCVFHVEEKKEPLGRLLVFGVGKKDAQFIKGKGGRMSYKFSTLPIKLANAATTEAPREEVPMETEAEGAPGGSQERVTSTPEEPSQP